MRRRRPNPGTVATATRRSVNSRRSCSSRSAAASCTDRSPVSTRATAARLTRTSSSVRELDERTLLPGSSIISSATAAARTVGSACASIGIRLETIEERHGGLQPFCFLCSHSAICSRVRRWSMLRYGSLMRAASAFTAGRTTLRPRRGTGTTARGDPEPAFRDRAVGGRRRRRRRRVRRPASLSK